MFGKNFGLHKYDQRDTRFFPYDINEKFLLINNKVNSPKLQHMSWQNFSLKKYGLFSDYIYDFKIKQEGDFNVFKIILIELHQ